MQHKIYTALKQTYARLGLGEIILKGQAASLEATGLVTEKNLDAVVLAQKQFLEALQSGMDKRVADALTKTKGVRQRESNGEGAVRRHELQELIEGIVGEKITALQKQMINDTKGACESVPAYSVRPLVKEKEHGSTAWPANEGFSVTHPGNDGMVRNYMSGARHMSAVNAGLSDKRSYPKVGHKPTCQGTSKCVVDDGYHVLHITEKMIHSEFRKVLMNLIKAYE